MQQLIESQSSPPPAAVMALPTTSPTIIPPNTFLNQRENTVGWTGGWSDEDHSIFLSGRAQYGNKWGEIAGLLRGKTISQLEYHAKMYDKKFGKAKKDTVGSWSDEEHNIFLNGRARYGNSWGEIARLLRGKSDTQTKYHAQIYDKKFGKEGEMVYIKGLIDEGSASSNDIKWFEFEMRKLTTKGRPTAR